MLDEVSFVLGATQGKEKDHVVNDPVLSRALIRSLEIIGEASAKVDPEFKSLYPNVEWRKMSNTRNRLIHDYFGVDYDIFGISSFLNCPTSKQSSKRLFQQVRTSFSNI
ncbi:HepT-like ribonuclease domain-containing protein [Pedobacter sp. KR3-3]|uniref:HepT-like ribonuclease domain-containing protein n=1 Tax=Pedobacter albus TaxID=3113905 RepID=A0ABU7I2S9_9SPHI|nr:HepT-like ribonuclease domain-containing protein [Pedobacter sp. KR3-3]MEE1943616.1 HepT-like ribonuclease domain-containing protein [Pedobacter sp. KR3-3]